MSLDGNSVVIVGGGIIGVSCAHYLAERGWRVTVIDRGSVGGGCSHGNCGLVCPSHVLPMAEPGAIPKALAALFNSQAAFSIKPRWDWDLWTWLVQFALRCNYVDMLDSAHSIQALLQSSRRLYDELFARTALDCDWETAGLFFVYRSRGPWEDFAETDRLLRETFGLAARRLDGRDAQALEPALQDGLAGGWWYERDAHLRPDKLIDSWKRWLSRQGVVFREGEEGQGFIGRDGTAAALRTAEGELEADAFILATGAWSPRWARELGCPIPIQPGKGYSVTMPRPAVCPRLPLLFPEHHVAVTPLPSAYRLGSMMEFAGYDTRIDPQRIQLLVDGARPYLREPVAEPVLETWYGWRPMTYDSRPIIDRAPAWGNVILAAGHNMLGLSMAPATGKLVAEMLAGQPPHLRCEPYSWRRFR